MIDAAGLSAYFERAQQAFQRAVSKAGLRTRSYLIGGFQVRLDYAGEALSDQFQTALEHNLLSSSATHADLEVCLWDTASTGTTLESPDWEALHYTERGNRRIYSSDDYVLIYDRRTSVFNMIDLRAGKAIYWVRDASWLPYYEIAAPLRYLFQGWLQSRGGFVLHSAAVGFDEGGALIAGPTGSGKSTTSLSCLDSELKFASDDYILVRTSPRPTAYSLYNSAKINVSDLAHFPEATQYIANPDRLNIEKALIFLQQGYSDRLITSFALRVLLLPQVSDGAGTTFEEIASADAFKRMAPDSVFTMLGNAALIFRGVRELTQSLPCYRLNIGHDRTRLVACIAELIRRHSQ